MKKIFIIIMMSLPLINYCQQNDNEKYTAEGFYVTQIDINGNEKELPYGKNVKIIYDTFFKSYDITFVARNGENWGWKLDYLGVFDNGIIKMKDHSGNIFTIIDFLKEKGTFAIMSEKDEDGNIYLYHMKNAKRL